MKTKDPSPLTKELKNLINHQNYLGLTSIISKLIKSFLNNDLQPSLKRREELRTKVQRIGITPSEKEILLKEIDEITKMLETRWYSNEFLYREYYIHE
jgi:hypothetical protein